MNHFPIASPPSLCRLLFLATALLLAGCDADSGDPDGPDAVETQKNNATAPLTADQQVIGEVLERAADAQAAGLGKGTVTVHGAWNYTGYSNLTPLTDARLVAVDVTITGHNANFDYDDIEIVDAQRKVSYGSNPNIALLTADGKPAKDMSSMPVPPAATRLLLIYGFPNDRDLFLLTYWRKLLTRDSVEIAPAGWELPYPDTEITPPAPESTKDDQ